MLHSRMMDRVLSYHGLFRHFDIPAGSKWYFAQKPDRCVSCVQTSQHLNISVGVVVGGVGVGRGFTGACLLGGSQLLS